MGIVFLICECCGRTFPDNCSPMVRCDCGKDWCCNECATHDGYSREYDDCSYCRQEVFEDSTLLNYALELLATTKEELVEKYKKKISET